MASAIIQGGDILFLVTRSPNNCFFYFNEQVPVDRNMLVFFLLFINDK